MTVLARALAVLILFGSGLHPAAAQPLPTDPRLVTGELENGLRYIVREHDNPPGRASAWLHVATGSLNETDGQRGIAHYLEHMAFNGSENFEPGTVVRFFEALGLTFGADQNAFTSFDQTTYILRLPDNKKETLDKAFLFLSDVAFRLSLLDEEIENERQVIMEEKRARSSAVQRVQEYIWERIAPGSTFGQRIPIGVDETILGMMRPDFVDYYSRWYIPSNMTLMVVADTDPDGVVALIRAHFSQGERAEPPVPADPGVKPYERHRAIVASDPEIVMAQVGIVRIDRPDGPATSIADARRGLVDQIGVWAFNKRLSNLVAEGTVGFQNGYAFSGDTFGVMRWAQAAATGEPARWRTMLEELATELQRARLHGFRAREVEDARRELLAGAERAVETEPTLPAGTILARMNGSAAKGEPIMSAEQNLQIVRALLPTITPEEVSRRFREVHDTSAVTFTVQVPSGPGAPTEDELLELGIAAIGATPEPRADRQRAESLLSEVPAPGEIAAAEEHEGAAVQSAWLSNNIRVHHRYMDYRKDQATVNITLAAGAIMETSEDRGIAEAAAIAWGTPATGALTSTDIEDLMIGKKVRVSGRAGVDTMGITVSGSPADLEAGMQLAHLMLTDPVIEAAAFDTWKQRQGQIIALRGMQPEIVAVDTLYDAIYPPGEARVRPLAQEQVDRITRGDAQAWLRRTIRAAPVEVSIVGDIGRERAVELAARYIGSLPQRERIGPETLAHLRRIERPRGPIEVSRDLATTTDKAMVIAGFFGSDQIEVARTRLLEMASRILSTRMNERIREQEKLAYSPRASSNPGVAFPGYGMFLIVSPTEPAKAEALDALVREMFSEFAAEGPSEGEMAVAKLQIATSLEERMREPGAWSAFLSSTTYRGTSLDDFLEAQEAYQSFTPERVRENFARHFTPERLFSIRVIPRREPQAPPGE